MSYDFNVDELLNNCLNYFIDKINNPIINNKIKYELIKPLTELLIKELYPYLLTAVIIVSLMFISIIGIFILILRLEYLK